MNYIEIIIMLIVASLFILSATRLYKNTKNGSACAGCRIADTCQSSEKFKKKDLCH